MTYLFSGSRHLDNLRLGTCCCVTHPALKTSAVDKTPAELSVGFVVVNRTKTSKWHECMYSLGCIRLCFPLPDLRFVELQRHVSLNAWRQHYRYQHYKQNDSSLFTAAAQPTFIRNTCFLWQLLTIDNKSQTFLQTVLLFPHSWLIFQTSV